MYRLVIMYTAVSYGICVGMNDMYDYSVKKEKSIKYELDDDELPF